jgi:hypothetical protein
VDVPEPPVMLVGLSIAVRPVDGLAVSMTVPVNPLIGETVIVDVVVSSLLTVRLVGLAEMLKSAAFRWMLMLKMLWNVRLKVRK